MFRSLVLNPKGRHYTALKAHMAYSFEDSYFDEDAIYMERNSRDFRRRIHIIDQNTEAVCDFLHSRSLACSPTSVIKEVFFPKFTTPEHYIGCRVSSPDAGFGGLFSLTFTSPAAAKEFFNALPCHKGPSLGTNFTLACPYTVLAHYVEMDWVAQFGVVEELVRVSVGLEPREVLLDGFAKALEAAERVAAQAA